MNLGKTLIKLSFGLVMIYGVSFASQQTNSKVKIGYALAGLAAHYAGADAEGEEFAANLGATAGAAAAGYAGGEVGATVGAFGGPVGSAIGAVGGFL